MRNYVVLGELLLFEPEIKFLIQMKSKLNIYDMSISKKGEYNQGR